jgi:hypothetical protein
MLISPACLTLAAKRLPKCKQHSALRSNLTLKLSHGHSVAQAS